MEASRTSFRNDIFETYLSVKFELLKHLKRRRLIIVAALAIVVPLIFYVKVPDTASEFADEVLTFVNILIVISAAMFAGDAVSSEFERKTHLLLFPTPQRRGTIFAGKFLAAVLATFLVVLLYYVTLTLQTAQLFGWGEIPREVAKSFLVSLIYVLAAVSVVYFFSAVLKRSISSTIVGFLSLIMVLPIISFILQRVNQEPWFIVTYSANLTTDVLGVSGNPLFGPGNGPPSLPEFTPKFGVGIAVMIAYTVVFLISGMLIASRRED
jgi:ABC-type transport system involved in multi-copper enzyme maturation permease subunit